MDLKSLLKKSGNDKCVECGDLKPSWGSIIVPPKAAPDDCRPVFLGCFICMHCSGAHRALGTHVCFVRSITLDTWSDRDLEAMRLGGNLRVNSIFEGLMFDDSVKPSPYDDMQTREAFIREKYVNLKYFVPAGYKVVGTEYEDEDDNTVVGDSQHEHQRHQQISVLSSSSVQARLAAGYLGVRTSGSGSVAASATGSVDGGSASIRLNCGITSSSTSDVRSTMMSPTKKKTSRRDLMSRQYSLPTIKSTRMSLDVALSPSHGKNVDVYESMNNSRWGDMTFEESLHTRSALDLETKSTNDAFKNPTSKGLHSSSKSEAAKDKMKGRRQLLERPKSARSLFVASSQGGIKARSLRSLHQQSSIGQLPSCREEKKENDDDNSACMSSNNVGSSSSKDEASAMTSTYDVLRRLEEEASKSRQATKAQQKSAARPCQPTLRRQLSSPFLSHKNDAEKTKVTRSDSSELKRRSGSKKKDKDDVEACSTSMSNLKTPTSRRRKTTKEAERLHDRLAMSCNTTPNTAWNDELDSPSASPTLKTHDEKEADPISRMLSPEMTQPRRYRISKSPIPRAGMKNRTNEQPVDMSGPPTLIESLARSNSLGRSSSYRKPSNKQSLRPASLHVQSEISGEGSGGRRRTSSFDATARARRRKSGSETNSCNVLDIEMPMGMPTFAVSGGASRIIRQVSDSDRRTSEQEDMSSPSSTSRKTTQAKTTRSKSPRTPRGRKEAAVKSNPIKATMETSSCELKEGRVSGRSSKLTSKEKPQSRPRSLDVSRRRKERRARTRQVAALSSASYHPEGVSKAESAVKSDTVNEEEGDEDILSDDEILNGRKPSSTTSTTAAMEMSTSSNTLQDSAESFADHNVD